MSNPVVLHSKLSFSGRDRWRNCPASVHLSAGLPDNSSPAAAEGTCAHTVAEFYVRQAFNLPGAVAGDAPMQEFPEGFDPEGKTREEWNEELRMHGKAYARFIGEQITTAAGENRDWIIGRDVFVMLELKVSIPSIHDQLFGTADCIIWIPSLRLLSVIDYKYGFGHVDIGTVDDTNPQLSAYMVAAAEVLPEPPQTMRVAVYQPRLPTAMQAPLDLPGEWLQRERLKLRDETAAVDAPGAAANVKAGDHCRYCKAKPKCPRTHNAVSTAIQAAGGLVDLSTMGEELVIALWASRTAFKAFWEDVEERVQKMAAANHPRVSVKVSKGRKMWADPKEAALYLMAMNRTDLLQPVAISEALPHLPAELRAGLVKDSAGSRTISFADAPQPHAMAALFQQFAQPKESA